MHLGIFAKTFPRPTLEATLDAIADRGITHVQFNMSCAGMPTLPERLDENLCVWIARCFRDRGLTMAAISGTFNLCDPDESRLEDNLRKLGVLAAACRWLDTRIITLCTGTRDPEDMWKWHPENVRRSTWETLIRAFREAVKIADRQEVTLAFEPERNNVVNSVARARMLLDEIESPWLKVVIDPANLMRADDRPRLGEILDEVFDWLGADIVLAHAKNPPYGFVLDDGLTIAEYLRHKDLKTLFANPRIIHTLRWILEKTGEVPHHEEEFIEVFTQMTLVDSIDFYTPYIEKLKTLGFAGPVVMHGMAEDEVAGVLHVIDDLIRDPKENG